MARSDEPQSLKELNRRLAAMKSMVTGGTRAVPGEGPARADIMLVGEQPGDQEDVQGRPFVGPAGKLLDRALAEAGIDRSKVYVTNAVKHFKFEQRGKRRLHSKPNAGEIKHYRWWLQKELELVRPKVVVAMGATAVLALAGKSLPIARNRGAGELAGRPAVITMHPSYLLRLRGDDDRHKAFADLVADLRTAKAMAAAPARAKLPKDGVHAGLKRGTSVKLASQT